MDLRGDMQVGTAGYLTYNKMFVCIKGVCTSITCVDGTLAYPDIHTLHFGNQKVPVYITRELTVSRHSCVSKDVSELNICIGLEISYT